MTHWHTQFGELRSILHEPPSASAWNRLCAILEVHAQHPERMSQRVLPYALQGLKRWPDALRVCPRRWLEDRAYTWVLVSLTRCVHLARAGMDDQGLRRVLSKPPISSVRVLDLRHNWVRALGAHHVSVSNTLTNVTHLFLGYNQIADEGAQSILESGRLGALTHLDLMRNGLSANALAYAPEQSALLERLQALNMGHNWLGERGAELLGARTWAHLRHLNLHANALGDVGCARLFEHPERFAALEHLDLGHNNLGPRSAQTLAWQLPHERIKTLSLQDNRLGTRGLHHLIESTRLKDLQVLDVRRNQLPSDGLRAFEDITHLRGLRGLYLDDNLLDARGVRALRNAPCLGGLHTLSLGRNALDDAAIEALCQLECVRHVHTLNLEGNRLGSDGCAALARAPFGQLRQLNVRANDLSAEDARVLRAAPWFCDLDGFKLH